MYKKGNILRCVFGKYNGEKVLVKDFHISHNPLLYTVELMRTGMEIALYETELMTIWQYDKHIGLIP